MITLITGQPGAGKTLLLVSEFLKPESDNGRPIIVDAIPDLVVPHEPAPALSTWTKTVEDPSSQTGTKLLFDFPAGSIIAIDEAQRVYRPRAVGSKVPPEVAAFETHRHQGLDFILITQHPNLIDANVRKLVGRHLHIRDVGILGRKVYEWPECGNVEQFRNAPVQRSYRLDSKSFGLYKSSSLHIKPKRGLPKGLILASVSLCLLLAGVGYAWHSISKKLNPDATTATTQTPQAAGAAVPSSSGHASSGDAIKTASDYLTESIPAYPGRPETAPMYAALLEVRNVPRVVGCVDTGKRCKCITQQGTDAGLDNMQCRNWIASPPFDPYTEQKQNDVAAVVPHRDATPPKESAPAPQTPLIADIHQPQAAPAQMGAASREGAGFRPS